jgi:hypothetical protein
MGDKSVKCLGQEWWRHEKDTLTNSTAVRCLHKQLEIDSVRVWMRLKTMSSQSICRIHDEKQSDYWHNPLDDYKFMMVGTTLVSMEQFR